MVAFASYDHRRPAQQILAIPAMDSNQKLRGDVRVSLEQIDRGEVREANFDAIRQRLRDEYDESGNQK